MLGDPDAIEVRTTTAAERGPVIQSGEVDMMSRNTTWTTSRDVQWGNFAQTMFYDGQGFMVPNSGGVSSISELEGATICVQQGTTTELNLQDYSNQYGMNFNIITFPDNISTDEAYTGGQCDSLTTDRSGLVSTRQGLANPADHTILPGTISEEPLGPVVPSGDDQWYDIVKMVMAIIIYAEAFGVTSGDIPTAPTGNTAVDRMLGLEGSYGQEEAGTERNGGAGRNPGRGQLRGNLRPAPGAPGHRPGGQPQRALERRALHRLPQGWADLRRAAAVGSDHSCETWAAPFAGSPFCLSCRGTAAPLQAVNHGLPNAPLCRGEYHLSIYRILFMVQGEGHGGIMAP